MNIATQRIAPDMRCRQREAPAYRKVCDFPLTWDRALARNTNKMLEWSI